MIKFEKTGSIGKFFLPLENPKTKFTFFVTFTFLLFDSGVCLPFKKGNELNLKEIKSETTAKHQTLA